MKRLSTAHWSKLRADYESGRVESFSELSKIYDVPLSTIKSRAQREQWDSLNHKTNKLAIQKAFERTMLDHAMDNEANVRAAMMTQHISEWNEHRIAFDIDEVKEDPTLCKNMKMTADALNTRQSAERKARGVDSLPPAKKENNNVVGFEVVAYDDDDDTPHNQFEFVQVPDTEPVPKVKLGSAAVYTHRK